MIEEEVRIMNYFKVAVITDNYQTVITRCEEEKDELDFHFQVSFTEVPGNYIFTFYYEKDGELEEALRGAIDFPKEKFILSLLRELSHEGIIKIFEIIEEE